MKHVINNLYWFLGFYLVKFVFFETFILHFKILRYIVVFKISVNGYVLTLTSVFYFDVFLHYNWELCNI